MFDKEIRIGYWMGGKYDDLPLNANELYPAKAMPMLVNSVLSRGYDVMIQQTGLTTDDTCILWIDNGKFRQR